jgi:predicted alpha/beta-fold hydrolase
LFYSENIAFKPEKKQIETPDNDFLEYDLYQLDRKDAPIAILLHGLEGSSNRYYIRTLAEDCLYRGMHVAALNFRSCGSGMNRQLRFYHSGEITDLQILIAHVSQSYPNSEIILMGFSLGANVIQVYLGSSRVHPQVKKAVCISAPYQLQASSLALMRGFNQIYQLKFLRSLKYKLEQKRKIYPELPLFKGSTLYDFDDEITSVIHGFHDAEQYYKQCSGAGYLHAISIPTLLIHSKQDPFCKLSVIPSDVIKQNKYLSTCITTFGGHVGYVTIPSNWMHTVLLNWVFSE